MTPHEEEEAVAKRLLAEGQFICECDSLCVRPATMMIRSPKGHLEFYAEDHGPDGIVN